MNARRGAKQIKEKIMKENSLRFNYRGHREKLLGIGRIARSQGKLSAESLRIGISLDFGYDA
jgi:hypothetical protein